MADYEKQSAAKQNEEEQEEQQHLERESGINGIPNSVLLAVLGGKLKPDDSMLGESETLAPSIAAKMSRAFGMDVSSVKVSRSDKMKGTGMKGMAQGNRVILSSDLDLNTLEGQEILGHELSHIHAQAQGIGMGHVGLLQNASLERQADFEGMRAARGLSIYQDTMDMGRGMNYGFGMAGVEGIQPLTGGISASAAAPMQAALFKPWTWFGSKKKLAANNAPAGITLHENVDKDNTAPILPEEDESQQTENREIKSWEIESQADENHYANGVPRMPDPSYEDVLDYMSEIRDRKKRRTVAGALEKANIKDQLRAQTKGYELTLVDKFVREKAEKARDKIERNKERLRNGELTLKRFRLFKKDIAAIFRKCGTEAPEARKVYMSYMAFEKEVYQKHPKWEYGEDDAEDNNVPQNEQPPQENEPPQENNNAVVPAEADNIDNSNNAQNVEEKNEEQPAEGEQQAPAAMGEDVKEDGVDPKLRDIAPLAWRRPTGGNGGEEGPELGVHFKQQEKGKASEAGALTDINSHAFLSLEYTKKSRVRGRHQRYRAVFGFYPSKGVNPIGYGLQGGTTAGQLRDDDEHAADVSRSYPITFRQLNTIAKEAGEYARDGYNLFSRNCTTFVADVTQKAGITIANGNNENIFQEENWTLGPLKRAGYGILTGLAALFPTDSFEGELQKQVGKDDLRHGMEGKKMVTADEVRRFRETRKRGGVKTFGYAPSAAAERMRKAQTGGLEGNYKPRNGTSAADYIEELDSKRLTRLWEKAVAEQALHAGGQLVQEAREALVPVFDEVEGLRSVVMAVTSGKLTNKEAGIQLDNYLKASPSVNTALHTWYRSYGHSCPIMGQFVSELFGLIKHFDTIVMNNRPTTKNSGNDETTDYGLSHLIRSNGELVARYAEKLAFGNTAEGKEKKRQLDEVNKGSAEGERIEKKNPDLYVELGIRETNIKYFNAMLYDMLDDRFDSGNVTQEDLEEAFLDIPEKELSDEEKPDGLEVKGVDENGKLNTFSSAMQSSTLRMLFGEETVDQYLNREGSSLKAWKNIEYNPEETDGNQLALIGVHEVTRDLLTKQKEKVQMLMETLARSPEAADISPLELAYKTIHVIESLYVLPVLGDKANSNAVNDLAPLLGTKQANVGQIVDLIKQGNELASEKNLYDDASFPGEGLVKDFMTMAQEILDKKKAISQNNT